MFNLDIFIRTCKKDFILLKYSLKSIIQNVIGYNKIIICVKENDYNLLCLFLRNNNFNDTCLKIVTDINYDILFQDKGYSMPDYCGQQISKMKADLWSDADFIMYVDSDIIFFNTTNVNDFFDENKKLKYPIRLWENASIAIIWKKCLLYLDISDNYEFMCSLPLIFPVNIIKKSRELIENKSNLSFVDECFYIYKNFGLSEFNIMGSILYKNNDGNTSFIDSSETWNYIFTHYRQFLSNETCENTIEQKIIELIQLKYNFGFTSMINNDEISKIHNKYYSEDKIMNKKSTNDIDYAIELYEKLYVSNFIFFIHKNDTCIADCLKTGILFEKFILSFLKQFIDPNKNILDIGANIGSHSIVYSNYTNKNVYSFEPQKVVFDILILNIKSNNCDNVIAYNFGVSNKNCEYHMNYDYSIKENTDGIIVDSKIIDDLNISDIGYVKIDVEGHEFETLQGITNILINNKPIILIKIHDSCPTKEQSLKLLFDIGYRKFYKLTHCDYIFMF
jgi:FkbM family methyltransferase